MRTETITRILDGVAGVRRDGAAWLIPEEVEVSVFIALPAEVLNVPRISRVEAVGDLIILDTFKGERFHFAAENLAGVKSAASEKRTANRGAGFR
ncbi:MAG: hypothetical protein EXR72_19455 [Myxococcales bacterium]|nr:hypothetical protein [Myxococcales bacterium]